MKNLKKLALVLLMAVLAVGVLAACSSEKSVLELLNEQGASITEDTSLKADVDTIYDKIVSAVMDNMNDATARNVALAKAKAEFEASLASPKKFVFVSAGSNAEAASQLASQVSGYTKGYFKTVMGKYTIGVVSK